MSDFGTQLRQAREQQGISLRQIATSTKISVAALEALERGDFSRLPGGIFSRAFVRSYAIEVGLEPDGPEGIVEQFLAELGAAVPDEDDAPRPDVTDDDLAFLERQRKAAVYLRVTLGVLAVLIVVALIAWQVSRARASSDDAPGAGQQSSQAAPSPPPVVPSVAANTTATAPPPEITAPVAAQGSNAVALAALRIEVVAVDSCWLRVTADGALVPARVLTAGQRQSVEAEREIVLQLGSAGDVTWTLNGRPGRRLGDAGQVRTVTISSENVAEFWQSSDERPIPTAIATSRP